MPGVKADKERMHMKRKIISLTVALCLCLGLVPVTALAAEPVFSDVAPDAWYGQAVTLCAQQNIMEGTGEDTFSPDRVLSQAECLVLALRLHDLRNGGDGVFDPAPEDWGKLTLTLADGTELTGFGLQNNEPLPGMDGAKFFFDWSSYSHNRSDYLCANLLPDPRLDREDPAYAAASEALHSWGSAHAGAATVQVGGMTIPGTVDCWLPLGNWVLAFHPEAGDDSEGGQAIHDALYSGVPSPSLRWAWPAAWYQAQQGLTEISSSFDGADASREFFAFNLARAVGSLPAVRTVDIPDMVRESSLPVYNLYQAGILTGVDEYGTFHAKGVLTRAQAAVMVARVLDQSQRVAAPLAPLPTEGYTLAYLMDGQPDCGITYPLCVLGSSEENAGHEGLLTLDGTLIPWPGRVPSFGLATYGTDYLGIWVYDDSTDDPWDHQVGLMDGQGNWVIPLDSGDDLEILFQDVEPRVQGPYTPVGGCYVDNEGHPVSQKFDWCGELTAGGRGFAGLDGKIYRIDFDVR